MLSKIDLRYWRKLIRGDIIQSTLLTLWIRGTIKFIHLIEREIYNHPQIWH